jgi:hypothetical protein
MSTIEQVEDVDDIHDLDDPEPLNQARVQTWEGAPAPIPPPPPPPAPRPPRQQPICPLPIPDAAMYGWAADHARTLDSPTNWAYPAVLTAFAARPIRQTGTIRPTLYTFLIGPPQDGKSLTYKRALRSMGMERSPNIYKGVPASDRGLEEILAPVIPEGTKKGEPYDRELKTWTIVMDEAGTLLNKMAIQGSSLSTALTHLWDEDEDASAIKGHKCDIYARLSMLGGLACKDRDQFSLLMGAVTMGGFYSRLIVCPGPTGWKFTQKWRPNVVIRHPSVVTISDADIDVFEDWRDEFDDVKDVDKKRGRIVEIAERVALISAAANHDKTLTPECIQAALRFAEWQEKIKSVYCASEALNLDGQITGAILDALAEEEGDYVKFRDLFHQKNWKRFGSSNVTRVKQSLIAEKIIDAELATDKTTGEEIPNRYTGMVAYHV